MGLSDDIISQFVKATKDDSKRKTETTVYGTTVVQNGVTYVQLDGSDVLTPALSTINVHPGERVIVMIKNHTATITGNISSPAARVDDVEDIDDIIETLVEFDNDLIYLNAEAELSSETRAMVSGKSDIFSTTVDYYTGQYVIYENTLYVFTTDKPAGVWDSSAVVTTTIIKAINDLVSLVNSIT